MIALPPSERKKDFIEMLLHHIVTFILFTGAYVINHVSIGMLVVYAIDFCNIFVHWAKALAGTRFDDVNLVNGACMWIFWGYCRLIAYPSFIYTGLFILTKDVPHIKDTSIETVNNILFVFCSVIFILSFYWFILITKMIKRALVNGE